MCIFRKDHDDKTMFLSIHILQGGMKNIPNTFHHGVIGIFGAILFAGIQPD